MDYGALIADVEKRFAQVDADAKSLTTKLGEAQAEMIRLDGEHRLLLRLQNAAKQENVEHVPVVAETPKYD